MKKGTDSKEMIQLQEELFRLEDEILDINLRVNASLLNTSSEYKDAKDKLESLNMHVKEVKNKIFLLTVSNCDHIILNGSNGRYCPKCFVNERTMSDLFNSITPTKNVLSSYVINEEYGKELYARALAMYDDTDIALSMKTIYELDEASNERVNKRFKGE